MSEDNRQKFDEIITELQHRQPFSAFAIIVSSGDRYLIKDPFSMVNGPSVVFYAESRSGRIVRIRKTEIVALEETEQRPAA